MKPFMLLFCFNLLYLLNKSTGTINGINQNIPLTTIKLDGITLLDYGSEITICYYEIYRQNFSLKGFELSFYTVAVIPKESYNKLFQRLINYIKLFQATLLLNESKKKIEIIYGGVTKDIVELMNYLQTNSKLFETIEENLDKLFGRKKWIISFTKIDNIEPAIYYIMLNIDTKKMVLVDQPTIFYEEDSILISHIAPRDPFEQNNFLFIYRFNNKEYHLINYDLYCNTYNMILIYLISHLVEKSNISKEIQSNITIYHPCLYDIVETELKMKEYQSICIHPMLHILHRINLGKIHSAYNFTQCKQLVEKLTELYLVSNFPPAKVVDKQILSKKITFNLYGSFGHTMDLYKLKSMDDFIMIIHRDCNDDVVKSKESAKKCLKKIILHAFLLKFKQIFYKHATYIFVPNFKRFKLSKGLALLNSNIMNYHDSPDQKIIKSTYYIKNKGMEQSHIAIITMWCLLVVSLLSVTIAGYIIVRYITELKRLMR